MYIDLRPTDRRRLSADIHEGTYREFLRNHWRECRGVARAGKRKRAEFATCLDRRITDDRNLRSALDHLVAKGGRSPGLEGMVLSEFYEEEKWQLVRALKQMLRAGNYRPGPVRVIQIPKGPGRGNREITILNATDRVVQRAIVQILQPYLDPTFSRDSFGSRPCKSREHALARAEELMMKTESKTLIVEDIRDAFTQVPRGRLLDIFRKRVQSKGVVELVKLVIEGGTKRGLAQGGPLSPLLMNVYLDHFLDQPWRKRYPETPLIRVVDDLLVLARDRKQAEQAHEALVSLLRPAGMPLKGCPDTAIKDLVAGDSVTWLGYSLRVCQGSLEAHLPDEGKPWDALADALAKAHEEPGAPLRARQIILTWMSQQGPCFAHTCRDEVYSHIEGIAYSHAFTEPPSRAALEKTWCNAHEHWIERRSIYLGRENDKRIGSGTKNTDQQMQAVK